MSRREILIVEDEEITALDLEATLTRMGYRVTAIAVTGEEAIAMVSRQPPDLVLMDIQLRGNMDGILAAKTIYRSFSVPIIYLTAHNDPMTLGRASQTPPFGYLVKPFEENALHNAIEVALNRADAQRQRHPEQASRGEARVLEQDDPQDDLTEAATFNAIQTQFFTATSHAFRTPLSKILLATEALEHGLQGTLTSEQERRFRLIKDSVSDITSFLQEAMSDALPEHSEYANYSDFAKLEIRVGQIQQAEVFPEARKPAYKLWIDFGEQGIKKSSAQITRLYQPADLINRQVLAVTNFPPRQIANFMSEVLVLGVVLDGGGVALIHPDRPVPLGSRLL
jgi:tRNA-binding protein